MSKDLFLALHAEGQTEFFQAVLFGVRDVCEGEALVLHVKGFVPFHSDGSDLLPTLSQLLSVHGQTVLGWFAGAPYHEWFGPSMENLRGVAMEMAATYFEVFQRAMVQTCLAYSANDIVAEVGANSGEVLEELTALLADLVGLVGVRDADKQIRHAEQLIPDVEGSASTLLGNGISSGLTEIKKMHTSLREQTQALSAKALGNGADDDDSKYADAAPVIEDRQVPPGRKRKITSESMPEKPTKRIRTSDSQGKGFIGVREVPDENLQVFPGQRSDFLRQVTDMHSLMFSSPFDELAFSSIQPGTDPDRPIDLRPGLTPNLVSKYDAIVAHMSSSLHEKMQRYSDACVKYEAVARNLESIEGIGPDQIREAVSIGGPPSPPNEKLDVDPEESDQASVLPRVDQRTVTPVIAELLRLSSIERRSIFETVGHLYDFCIAHSLGDSNVPEAAMLDLFIRALETSDQDVAGIVRDWETSRLGMDMDETGQPGDEKDAESRERMDVDIVAERSRQASPAASEQVSLADRLVEEPTKELEVQKDLMTTDDGLPDRTVPRQNIPEKAGEEVLEKESTSSMELDPAGVPNRASEEPTTVLPREDTIPKDEPPGATVRANTPEPVVAVEPKPATPVPRRIGLEEYFREKERRSAEKTARLSETPDVEVTPFPSLGDGKPSTSEGVIQPVGAAAALSDRSASNPETNAVHKSPATAEVLDLSTPTAKTDVVAEPMSPKRQARPSSPEPAPLFSADPPTPPLESIPPPTSSESALSPVDPPTPTADDGSRPITPETNVKVSADRTTPVPELRSDEDIRSRNPPTHDALDRVSAESSRSHTRSQSMDTALPAVRRQRDARTDDASPLRIVYLQDPSPLTALATSTMGAGHRNTSRSSSIDSRERDRPHRSAPASLRNSPKDDIEEGEVADSIDHWQPPSSATATSSRFERDRNRRAGYFGPSLHLSNLSDRLPLSRSSESPGVTNRRTDRGVISRPFSPGLSGGRERGGSRERHWDRDRDRGERDRGDRDRGGDGDFVPSSYRPSGASSNPGGGGGNNNNGSSESTSSSFYRPGDRDRDRDRDHRDRGDRGDRDRGRDRGGGGGGGGGDRDRNDRDRTPGLIDSYKPDRTRSRTDILQQQQQSSSSSVNGHEPREATGDGDANIGPMNVVDEGGRGGDGPGAGAGAGAGSPSSSSSHRDRDVSEPPRIRDARDGRDHHPHPRVDRYVGGGSDSYHPNRGRR
ncbi:hypothetical protein HKX48_000135 [Thoreauomyces humboldtii]|nr:hypothetical protein HKX48_000135 [Thoreauomyces humboldtii]